MEIVRVTHCYSCGSAELETAFASESRRHNSLMRVDSTKLSVAAREVQKVFALPHWKICSVCGLIFAGLRPGDKDTADWYLELFKISEERGYDTSPLPQEFVEGKEASAAKLFDLLTSQSLLQKGCSVLHVRCATGAFLAHARNRCDATVAGTDFFPSCVSHANAALGDDTVKLMTGPLPDNPFPDRRYDLIVSNHMITHAHDPAALVQRFSDWLKPKGVLFVMNEPDHAKKLLSLKAYPRGINFFHKQLFSEDTFRSAMSRWGFSLTGLEGQTQTRRKRDLMYICKKAAGQIALTSSAAASRKLLRQWSLRRRLSELLGFASN